MRIVSCHDSSTIDTKAAVTVTAFCRIVVAVSVISGLYPARRAMKLSSLAAIRSAE